MVTYFCPACWSAVPDEVKICPQCGKDLGKYLELSIEEKYILALRHPVSENRIIAARFLGEIGTHKVLPEFERMLREEQEYYVLREVVRALTLISDPLAYELLGRAAGHRYRLISSLAKRYLTQ